MKLREEIKRFSKEDVYDNYVRIVDKFKEYEKITKQKMIDEIYQVYDNPKNIIDICTVRELKFLKMIFDGKHEFSDQERKKYRFEIENLKHKYLIWWTSSLSFIIPEEIYDKVSQSLHQVDWKEAKEKDRINEIVVGIVRIHGEIGVEPLLQISCSILELTVQELNQHFIDNKLFQYYVYFSERYIEIFHENRPVFIYQDYYNLIDELEEARKRQGIAYTKNVEIEEYINMFYYGFNINNSVVGKFYQKLNYSVFYNFLTDYIHEVVLLNSSREYLLQYVDKHFENDKKFLELMNQALDEIPSGALNGATPKEAKYFRLEEEKNRYKREVSYIKQMDAHLSKKEGDTFYKIYFALLEYTNQLYQVNPNIKKIYKQKRVNPNELIGIVEKFWKDKKIIIPKFLEENIYHFKKDELKLVENISRGFRDMFIIAKFDQDYTCLLSENKCYMIKGIRDNIDNIISYQELPSIVVTAIMPFYDKIIYDGIIQSADRIALGSSFETMVQQELKKIPRIYQL